MAQAHTAYVISDLHLGQGRDIATGNWHVLEDFRFDDTFCAFVEHISAGKTPVELVIAGDFIEYLQILPELGLKAPKDHLGITEQESLQRTHVVLGQSSIATGHPEVFAALRRFIEKGNILTILAGNHDIDILWTSVWLLLYYNICPPGTPIDRFRLVPFSHTIGSAARGRVYIEHGQEHDRANRYGDQMQQPFVHDATGVKRLKRCWGTLFVDKVYNSLEEQCWFIDNVKPISRVIKMGLRGDFVFTATAMALLAKFFLTKGTPFFGGVSFSTPGVDGESDERSTEKVMQAVQDEELRDHLGSRLMQDPAFRQEFEQEMQEFGDEEQQMLQEMQQGATDMVWDTQQAAPYDQSFSFSIESEHKEDAYQQAAREVMEQDSTISTVIMGHTHFAIDRLPLTLNDGRSGYFFNSGTWTPRLNARPDAYSWDDLSNPDNYTSALDYLVLTPDTNGEYFAELRSWNDDNKG